MTKVSLLTPGGLCNVHALMVASDPAGMGRDTFLPSYYSKAQRSQSTQNTAYFLRRTITEWPSRHSLSDDTVLTLTLTCSHTHIFCPPRG